MTKDENDHSWQEADGQFIEDEEESSRIESEKTRDVDESESASPKKSTEDKPEE